MERRPSPAGSTGSAWKPCFRAASGPGAILLDSGCFAPWSGPAGAASVEPVAVAVPETRTTVTGVRAPKADEQTIRPMPNCCL